MTDIVFSYRGTLDKFIGDTVMAVFGSPVTSPDDPQRALQAAKKMLESIEPLNAKLTQQNLPKISIGIVLNSGLAVAGNIGSPKRLDYTVIGNVVNLATRVEELNKELKTCLLLTENTYQYVADEINADVVTERMVKGCSKPIKVYGVRNLSCTGSV
jgi:adenylate cyclase